MQESSKALPLSCDCKKRGHVVPHGLGGGVGGTRRRNTRNRTANALFRNWGIPAGWLDDWLGSSLLQGVSIGWTLGGGAGEGPLGATACGEGGHGCHCCPLTLQHRDGETQKGTRTYPARGHGLLTPPHRARGRDLLEPDLFSIHHISATGLPNTYAHRHAVSTWQKKGQGEANTCQTW